MSESGTAGVASTSSTSGGTPCVGVGLALCGELCLDVTADPEACGVGCVSCILLFGPKAECHDGVCMAPSGGDDDRGDD